MTPSARDSKQKTPSSLLRSPTRWQIRDHSPDDEAVHSIDITPAMKKSLMKEGQPISRNVTPPAFDWTETAREALAG